MQNYYKADKLFHLRLRLKQFLNRLGRSASIQNIRRDLQARAKHSATTCTKLRGRRSVQSDQRQVTMSNQMSHLLFADIDPSMRVQPDENREEKSRSSTSSQHERQSKPVKQFIDLFIYGNTPLSPITNIGHGSNIINIKQIATVNLKLMNEKGELYNRCIHYFYLQLFIKQKRFKIK